MNSSTQQMSTHTQPIPKSETPGMFSEIAPHYDLLNHVLSLNIDRLWRRKLVRMANVPKSGSVLDVCTGTGDVAIAFGRRLEYGSVAGLDMSGEMLGIGQAKLRKRRLAGRVSLFEGDALLLPFASGSFDAATVAFGLRNLPDYEQGVREMVRTLKPRGRLLILEFCPPNGKLSLKAYDFYLRNVLPVVGGLVSGSRRAYRHLASSIGDFMTRDEILAMLTGAGLQSVRARRLTGGIAYIYYGEKPGRD
jgi:demethylmenaquinone methyltransferase/2-methoxy-6-polyprenyl-1,4-benzoquinol methylase